MNAYKDRVRQRVNVFIDTLSQASVDLSEHGNRKGLRKAIETLSKVRNNGPGKHNYGLILLDQFFAVP